MMKKDFQIAGMDKQRCDLTASLRCVAREIAALGPSPEKPGVNGPAFVKTHHAAPIGERQDGMMGGIFMDMLLGGFFGSVLENLGAPEWVADVQWGTVAEIADEIWLDRRTTTANDNGFELGVGGPMTGAFNRTTRRAPIAQDADLGLRLPQRRELEQAYATLARKLDGWNPPQRQRMAFGLN